MTEERTCDNCKYEMQDAGVGACGGCCGHAHWEPKEPEMVDHPAHYNRDGSMECIDEMVLVFGAKATMDFCLLSVWKYRYRAADKGGAEDLEKSDWYMRKYQELEKKLGFGERKWEC